MESRLIAAKTNIKVHITLSVGKKELSKTDELISNCDGLDQGESDEAKPCC
jgi:hypothetical protein